jgi:hypothetical protein
VFIWQPDSNLSPLAIPLEHIVEPSTCLLSESGAFLFVAGLGAIWLLLIEQEDACVAGVARATMAAQKGRVWTQPTASRSNMLVVRDGGTLHLSQQSIMHQLHTDRKQKHLVGTANDGLLLIWELDKVGLARHIVHGQPPLQV